MAETARKIEYPTEAHREADELLARIAEAQTKLAAARTVYLAEINMMSTRLKAAMQPVAMEQATCEKKLEKLMKTNRFRFFDGSDRVDLAHGALLFAIEERVKRAKAVLRRLEETGAEEQAFIVTKAVNWEYLEGWTDERLIEVGTKRKKEEKFSYEVFGKKEP